MIQGRIRNLVDGALLIEYPGAPDEIANQRAARLARAWTERSVAGLFDAIPGARTLLVLFDPAVFDMGEIEAETIHPTADGPPPAPRQIRIPVCYGGQFGPDLDELARSRGLSAEDFIRLHREASYRVAFIGFAPGFPYLLGLPAELSAARLPSPRPRVPSGSVGIGGPYTGIYPAETPGGWRLVGNVPLRLFDPGQPRPSLLAAGDQVAFEAIAARDHERMRGALTTLEPFRSSPGSKRLARFLSGGLFSSVQGAPRFGLGSSGVPAAGAMDPVSLRRANAILGNAPLAQALEMTLLGPRLEFLEACKICLTGADIEAELNGVSVRAQVAIDVPRGGRLAMGRVRTGARSYLAFEGGLAPATLGESRRLEKGAELFAAISPASGRSMPPGGASTFEERVVLRVVLGPQEEHFTQHGKDRFFSSEYRVSAQSDRRGVRLEGPPLELNGSPDIPPEGTAPGAVQVPGNGLPIILGPDRPVTGGYAKIATVIGADLPIVAQARPGTALRFQAVSLGEAFAARRR